MKKVYFFTIVLVLSCGAAFAQSARDIEHFASAELAIAQKNCDNALYQLQEVSRDGKDEPRYVLLMGEMNECKGNKEDALFFYKKYMAMHPNDTTQSKIDKLQSNFVENDTTQHKRNTRCYHLVNVGMTMVTGNKYESTYKAGWKLAFVRGYTVFHKHATLEIGVEAGFLVNPNKEWFADALYVQVPDIKSLGSAFNPSLNVSLMAVLYKNKKMTLTAGASAGYSEYYTRKHDYVGDDENVNNLSFASPVLGLKARLYYKHKFTAFAEYTRLTIPYLDVKTAYNEYNAVPLNMGLISFGVGIYTSFKQ